MTLSLLAGAAMVGACSLTVDADRTQCASDSDCTARGPNFSDATCVRSFCQPQMTEVPVDDAGQVQETEWGCLGKGMKPDEPGTAPFTVSMKFSGVLSGQPFPNIDAKLCKKIDVTCTSPTDTATSNADGIATFTNVAGPSFSGYMMFGDEKIYPGLYFYNPSVNGNRENLPVQVVTSTDVTLLTTNALKTPQIAGKGLALINVVNCLNKPASGVHFKTDSVNEGNKASYFYAVQGIPANDTTETDVSGFGGIINADEGAVTMEGVVTVDGEEKHVGTIGFLIKPDSITYMKIIPDANAP